jgi:hypothetical protein
MRTAARLIALVALAGCGRLGFDPSAAPDAAGCVEGTPCALANLCLAGVTSCDDDPVCVADQPVTPGTPCAAGTCDPAGVCVGPDGTVVTPPGAVAGDLAGWSVAIDGDWIVAGAPDSTVGGTTFAGAAFVLRRQPDGGWVETQRLVASDPAASDVFGNYVAIDGDRIMIGARWRGAMNEGAVYAFEWNGNSWQQTDLITLPQPTTAIELGATIDIDGDRAVVAADYGEVDGSYGSSYVLERQDDATWTIVATLTSPAAERLGFSIDLDGDRVALGSLWDTGPSMLESGAVRVFERQDTGVWSETAELWPAPPPPGAYSDAIGSAVAFDGEVLIAGDQLYDEPAYGTIGGIIVFERAAETWSPTAHLREAAPIDGGGLGRSLAIDGDRILATSLDWDTGEGRLSVFRRGVDGAWHQVARLVTPTVGSQAGYALGGHEVDAKLSVQGDEVVVGYPGLERGAEMNTGGIVIYDVTGL